MQFIVRGKGSHDSRFIIYLAWWENSIKKS